MQAEELRKQSLKLEGWHVHLSSYRVGVEYLAEVAVESSGLTISRATNQNRSMAERSAIEAAARLLDFDLTVGG